MSGHVHQVAHIRGQLTQAVAGNQCDFRMRRHFHQMNVKVQKAGMAHCAGQISERGFEQLARLDGAGAGRRLASPQVPHAPGRAVEDRLREDKP